MHKISLKPCKRKQCRTILVEATALIAGWLQVMNAQVSSMQTSETGSRGPWTAHASVAVKETFDENVYLQNITSNAFQHSWVTAVSPSLSAAYQPGDIFRITLCYSPEVTFFHSASTENFTTHRVQLGLSGTNAQTQWELAENFLAIDGDDVGPRFFGPGGAPAGGGPQIRDRRDALVERGQVRLIQNFGDWFVRPAVSGYYHDFRTLHRTTPGYQNYVDRSDWNAGADLGRELFQDVAVNLGWRYGQQAQAKLFDFPEHYHSDYERVLLGIEGKPLSWIALAVCAGPEFRQYAHSIAAGFGARHVVRPFVDSSITFLPSRRDSLTVSGKIFEQPGFSGRSTYVDSTYELSWRHKFGQKFTLGAGLRGYNTDFIKPTDRNDWIVTPSVVASYAFNRHLVTEASYLHDDAFSLVPNMAGREYTRNAAALGVKLSF